LEKRYQVFVSSTFQDLEEERQEVIHALLELGCFPAGMELFPAANTSQWEVIKKVIDECDYYVLIIGGRYGSIGADGMSYTEMEYQYALSIDKPVVAFLHKDPGQIAASKSEETESGKQKLATFRALAQQKMCKFWTTPADLGAVVSRSITILKSNTPAVGWVRANQLASSDATVELLQLHKEVERLKTELAQAQLAEPKGVENFAQGDESVVVRYKYTAYNTTTSTLDDFYDQFDLPWDRIFGIIGPTLINGARDAQIIKIFNEYIKLNYGARTKKNSQLMLQEIGILREDFETIIIQLRTLGYIDVWRRSIGTDSQTGWALTPYGDKYLTEVRAIRRSTTLQDKNKTDAVVISA
jgi:hypothetical protein